MTDKTFVDTNILVYAHGLDDKRKHTVARDALRELWHDGTGVIGPQVFQEFYVSVTRELNPGQIVAGVPIENPFAESH